jgi:hypothetical protein
MFLRISHDELIIPIQLGLKVKTQHRFSFRFLMELPHNADSRITEIRTVESASDNLRYTYQLFNNKSVHAILCLHKYYALVN